MLGKHLCCARLNPRRNSKTTPRLCSGPQTAPPINKTFNSLYESAATDSEAPSATGSGSWSDYTSQTLTTIDSDPGCSDSDEPDLASVFASRRLTRPISTGSSNSIVEDDMDERLEFPNVGYGPVPKMSPDPYMDFKKSMEEMVEALGIDKMDVESEAKKARMQELLLSYLALNRRNAHQYIICAFADVFRGLNPN